MENSNGKTTKACNNISHKGVITSVLDSKTDGVVKATMLNGVPEWAAPLPVVEEDMN